MPLAFFVMYPISADVGGWKPIRSGCPLTMSILGSLAKWWWCWSLFYLLSGLMIVGIGAAAVFAVDSSNGFLLIGLGPLTAAAVLIYFRLLGRLGWRMTTNVKSRS